MEWNKGNGRSLYITNLKDLLAKYREADQELRDITMKQVHLIHQLKIQDSCVTSAHHGPYPTRMVENDKFPNQ